MLLFELMHDNIADFQASIHIEYNFKFHWVEKDLENRQLQWKLYKASQLIFCFILNYNKVC